MLVCVVFLWKVLVIMVIIMWKKIKKERKLSRELKIEGLEKLEKGELESIKNELNVDEKEELMKYEKKWEFKRDKIKLGKKIGDGEFGVVLKDEDWGIVEGEMKRKVEVKMVKRNEDSM